MRKILKEFCAPTLFALLVVLGPMFLLSFERQPTPRERYFFIGYMGDIPEGKNFGNLTWIAVDGNYPNKKQVDRWIEKNSKISNIVILSITEQSISDYQRFNK